MKIATVLFRSGLLAAAAVSSACVGYPVYSEPVDAVYYPVEQPVYYPQTAYYPYPVYRSNDPSYLLWYNNNHYYDRDRGHGHYDHDRDHDRDHGHNGRGRDTGYDNVRRDLCRDGRCDDRNNGNGRGDRGDRGDRNDNRKPPPVAFQPRPRDNVVAPRNPRDSGRVVNPRPQQPERTSGTVNSKPARIIDIQNQVKVTAPPPPRQERQERQERRQDNDASRRDNNRDRQRRAQ